MLKELLITIGFIFLPLVLAIIIDYLIDILRKYPILDKYFFDKK